MAEALVSVLLDRLVTITTDKIRGELNLVTGVEEEVKTLTSNLTAIQAVLKDAEARQAVDTGVRHWLHQLNEVSDEMDNVLDVWSYQVLKQRIEGEVSDEMDNVLDEWSTQGSQVLKQQMEGENVKKVCCPSFSSCFRFGQVSRLNNRRDIGVRIKKLNEKLALIDKEKQRFNFQNNTPRRGPEIPRQETTCFPSDKIFGRENEKSIILSKLLSESSPDCKVPLIIPIVGMGGMGKTTLSQLVYNDQKVKAHFDERIWVCVSDPFDEIKIARAIVEGLDKTSKTPDSLQNLMRYIHELIKEKKFLLVLDDVWNPRHTQWEELIKPFRDGAMGSRVLVTTRNEEVATLMKATAHVIHMKQLSEELCRSLFYYNAGRDICSESKMFRDVGEKIVKKCDGLPLAAKTLGSLMHEKRTLKEWEDVLNSKLWELEDVEQQVFRPLLLSYYDLTQEIRNCLLYCVIFPKDYVYNKDNLVELWMSQNYLTIEGSKEMERLGQKYFDKLVMRSFFQEVEAEEYGETKCKIHDIIHDFMSYMTKKECLILNGEGRGAEVGRPVLLRVNEKVRHLTLIYFRPRHILDNFRSCENVRTLVVLDSSGPDFSIGGREIVQLKYVRTLTCSRYGVGTIPKEIRGLIHLRYLDLSENRELEKLPDTMGSLYNLQTLRLVNCRRLNKVDLGRLINLRHLSVRGCRYLKLRGIERLTNLQTLDEFYVQYGEDGNKLEHLKNLNQLQGRLTITNSGAPPVREGDAAIIVNKAHLLHLFLNCEFGSRWDLTALQPPPGLESLEINRYTGKLLSTVWWSSLHRLRLLTLSRGDILPSLGNLASLESLNIKGIYVSTVGVEFLGIHDHDQSETNWRRQMSFPKLKQLTFDHMLYWKEWEGVKEDSEKMAIIMPCLSELTISVCNRVEALPEFLWKTPLQKLHISNSSILQKLHKRGTGEQWAKISHIPTINV